MDAFDKVREFHRVFGLIVGEHPTTQLPDRVKRLRVSLLFEEAKELKAAIRVDSIVDIADALADLLYVVYGTAVVYGIPIQEVFEEVHRSNMSKLGPDGEPLYRESDGKVQKGPAFTPPDLWRVLAKFMPNDAAVDAAREAHRRYVRELDTA